MIGESSCVYVIGIIYVYYCIIIHYDGVIKFWDKCFSSTFGTKRRLWFLAEGQMRKKLTNSVYIRYIYIIMYIVYVYNMYTSVNVLRTPSNITRVFIR